MVYQRQKKEKKTRLVIRGPPSLGERVKKIQAEEEQLSQNQLLLSLLETGMLSRNWGAANWERIKEATGSGSKEPIFDEVLPELLDAGLAVLLFMRAHQKELGSNAFLRDVLDLALETARKTPK